MHDATIWMYQLVLQGVSQIQGYTSPSAKATLKTRFRARFNNHVTSHMTHKIDE